MEKSLAEYLSEVRRAIPAKDGSSTHTEPTAPISIDLSTYRPISDEEKSFIAWLLNHGALGASNFLPQLEGMLVRNWCKCGCPSISLEVASTHQPIESSFYFLADKIGKVDGLLMGVMLRQKGARLVDLELYDLEGENRTFGFPLVEALYEIERENRQPSL